MKNVSLVALCVVALGSGAPAHAARWIVPGSAHAQGAAGTNWRTDLTVVNPAAQAAGVTIWFLAANTDNGTLPVPATRNVPAGGQLVVPDVLDTLFGRSGGGALLVESSEATLTVTSRTYNKLPDREYGMALAGVPADQAIAAGETAHLVYLAKSERYRSNVGFAGTTAQRGTVSILLRDQAGQLIGQATRDLLPYGQTQIDDVFGTLGAAATTAARAEVTGTVPMVSFATVIDNQTGDPFAVVAQKAAAATADQVIPSTAHKDGANGAKYRSDLRVFNPGSQAATITLSLYPGGATTASPVTRIVPLAAGALAPLDDVLLGTFGMDDAYGALRITSTLPVLALTNTYNEAPEGTSGQELPGVPVSSFASPVDLLRFAGISGSGFRTNVLFVNLGTAALDLQLTARDGSGGVLSTAVVNLPATSMTQANNVFPDGATGFLEIGPVQKASAAAAAGGATGYFALATVINNASNDPFQVTPVVWPGAPLPGACITPSLPAVGSKWTYQVTAPDGLVTFDTTYTAISDTVSTKLTHTNSPAGTTTTTSTETIAYLSGGLVGLVRSESSTTGLGFSMSTVLTFSAPLVGGPGPKVCGGFVWDSPSVVITNQSTIMGFPTTVTSNSVPSHGNVVSTDETITVPAGTFKTYRTFVRRDDGSTTESWLVHDGAVTAKQVDVTSKGTQTTLLTSRQ